VCGRGAGLGGEEWREEVMGVNIIHVMSEEQVERFQKAICRAKLTRAGVPFKEEDSLAMLEFRLLATAQTAQRNAGGE
jgi:hypothetical protein